MALSPTSHGTVILPISRVGFGFAAGGSDFHLDAEAESKSSNGKPNPFGGGSGGGVSIRPIAFLVVGNQGVHIVPLDNQTHLFEKIIDSAPQVIDQIQSIFQKNNAGSGMATSTAPTYEV